MNTILVIHHSADLDGISSREIAKRALGSTADYLGWDYSDDIPDTSLYTRVYLIDVSFPPKEMAVIAHKLVWIDHHASAIKDNPTFYGGLRIDGVAACRLAYQFFFGDPKATKADYVEGRVIEPRAIRLLGMFDIWDKSDPDVDPFQLGMQGETAPEWDLLLDMSMDKAIAKSALVGDLLTRGRAIQQYLKVTQAQLSNESGYDATWEGLNFRVLNTPQKGSMQFDASIKEEHDGCIRYYWNGELWAASLYGVLHKKDIDLSVIAKKYGGGGHKQACGLTFKTLPEELGGPAVVTL